MWSEPLALGLGLLIVLRPWRDGLTFVAFNAYFYALILILAALWCARGLLRPAPLRSPAPLMILGAYVALAWATGFSAYSHQWADRALQSITACLLVFAMASNGLRTRRAVTIVLGAVVVGALLNSLWTIFHYNVMLRGMRQVLKENPLVLEQYFGVTVPTPELKHRIESNRAFGTFLFPNALAAYLILGIPVLVAALPSAGRAFAQARRSVAPKRMPRTALGITLLVGVVVLVVLSMANELIGLSKADQKPVIQGTYEPYLFFVPIAGVFGSVVGWFTMRRGLRALGLGFMGGAVTVALAASLIALWLSYSRGAMLALVLAGGATILLMIAGRLPWAVRYTRAAAGAVLLAAMLWSAGSLRAQEVDGYRIPEPAPSSIDYLQRKESEFLKEMQTLNIEGMDRRIDNLVDPGSMRLRLTYWRVSLRMLADNFWTGVGPGNFRVAYPKYQYLGAGSAETAHNDYLQAFCETGVLGGAVFLAFWVYLAVWGGRRILMEPDAETRRWLAATYCGTGALAIHSLLDFNLQNPSLSLLAFAMAGTFFAIATLNTPADTADPEGSPVRARVVAGALGLLVLVTTSSVIRVFFFDLGLTEGRGFTRFYQVGDRKYMESRLEAAQVVKHELTRPDLRPGAERFLQLLGVLRAIPDITELQTVSTLRVPLPENPKMFQRIKPGQAPPMNSYVFFDLNNLPAARALLAKSAEHRLAVLREWDKSYPHDAEFAAHIFSWYDLLFGLSDNAMDKVRYAAEAERWARIATERSPESFIWWSYYAKALWMRGSVESSEAMRIDYYRTGLQYYRKAADLYPTGPSMAFQLGQALQKLGEALVGARRTDEGQPLLQESAAMYERSVVLDRYTGLVQ